MTPSRWKLFRLILLSAYSLTLLLTTSGARHGRHHGRNERKLLHFLRTRRSILNFPTQLPGNPLWQFPIDPYSLPTQHGFHQRLFGATIPFPSEVQESLIRRQMLPSPYGQPMMQGRSSTPSQFQPPNNGVMQPPSYGLQPFMGQQNINLPQPLIPQENVLPVSPLSQQQPYGQQYQFPQQTYMGQMSPMPNTQGQMPPNQGQMPPNQGQMPPNQGQIPPNQSQMPQNQMPPNQGQMQMGQNGATDYSKYADLPPDQRLFMEQQDRDTVERMTYQLQHPNTVQVVKRMVCLYGNLYYRPENVIYEVPAYRLVCRLGADGNAFVELERKTNIG